MFRLFFLICLVAFPLEALADWNVVKVSKSAYYTTDRVNWIEITADTVIPDRSWVATRGRGRLVVQKGNDRIMIQRETLTALISRSQSSNQYTIQQQHGIVTLEVTPGIPDRVKVRTPHLAAVVKGTTLTVDVSNGHSNVSVSSGNVSVSMDGQSYSVSAGQSFSSNDGISSGSSQSQSSSNNSQFGGGAESDPGKKAGSAQNGDDDDDDDDDDDGDDDDDDDDDD